MTRSRSSGAIRALSRLVLFLAVLVGLLGHTAMGGQNDCGANAAMTVSAIAQPAPDHLPGGIDHANPHAHSHDAAWFAASLLVAVAASPHAWRSMRTPAFSETAFDGIERPPRLPFLA